MGTLRIGFLSALVLELLAMIGVAMVATAVGIQLVGGHIELKAGLTVLLLAPELYLPVRMVGQHFHASTDGLEAAGRLFAALDTGPERTFDGDPLGTFHVTQNGFSEIGKRIFDLNLPTAIIMEGGYANEALGNNIVTLLERFK